jgi:hypothetical protein
MAAVSKKMANGVDRDQLFQWMTFFTQRRYHLVPRMHPFLIALADFRNGDSALTREESLELQKQCDPIVRAIYVTNRLASYDLSTMELARIIYDFSYLAIMNGDAPTTQAMLEHCLGMISPNDVAERLEIQLKIGRALRIQREHGLAIECFKNILLDVELLRRTSAGAHIPKLIQGTTQTLFIHLNLQLSALYLNRSWFFDSRNHLDLALKHIREEITRWDPENDCLIEHTDTTDGMPPHSWYQLPSMDPDCIPDTHPDANVLPRLMDLAVWQSANLVNWQYLLTDSIFLDEVLGHQGMLRLLIDSDMTDARSLKKLVSLHYEHRRLVATAPNLCFAYADGCMALFRKNPADAMARQWLDDAGDAILRADAIMERIKSIDPSLLRKDLWELRDFYRHQVQVYRLLMSPRGNRRALASCDRKLSIMLAQLAKQPLMTHLMARYDTLRGEIARKLGDESLAAMLFAKARAIYRAEEESDRYLYTWELDLIESGDIL